MTQSDQSIIQSQQYVGGFPADIWVAYYPDMSSVVVFTNELDALRYAVENHSGMWVSKITPGIPIGEQVQ